jgi:hypothetical protein
MQRTPSEHERFLGALPQRDMKFLLDREWGVGVNQPLQ